MRIKEIKGHSGYFISDCGKAFSCKRDGKMKEIKPIFQRGYALIRVYRFDHTTSDKRKKLYVHRLVAQHFIENDNAQKTSVCHRNGDRKNNHYTNLYWGDVLDNARDAVLHGGYKTGDKNKSAKLTSKIVKEIREIKYYNGLYSELARKYSVSSVAIRHAYKGSTWKSI